ncbi:MAG: VIT1/CCC1 transporter family protein [bacterium]|nr:VIT1/CCC1 transporter family protein [bacterium]
MDTNTKLTDGIFSRITPLYIRNFIFGVEDSLVSTVGLLSGVAIAGVERHTILLTGLVLIFVEAFSMGVGSFLSEHSVEEYAAQREVSSRRSVGGAVIMFGSYLVSGFIPLAPYVLWQASSAFWISIVFSLAALFLLGACGARLFKIGILRKGFEMLFVGGIAIGVGVFVGQFFAGF